MNGIRWGFLLAGTAVAAAVLLTGCGRNRQTVIVAGSTAFQPFAEKLAEEYMAANPEASVAVQGGGSAVGIQAALSGTASIGVADLVTLPPEASVLNSVVVARDGIAVVVHPSNPVGNLTGEQIRDLFSGKIANWKDVGGGDHAVTVVSREAGSGTRTSFEQIVGGIALTPNAIVQDSNGTIRETVANDAHAVGYLSHGLLNDKIKSLTVDGQPCTTEAVVAGQYKLVRPVFCLTRAEALPAAKAFIDYMLSVAGQASIQRAGLIPAR